MGSPEFYQPVLDVATLDQRKKFLYEDLSYLREYGVIEAFSTYSNKLKKEHDDVQWKVEVSSVEQDPQIQVALYWNFRPPSTIDGKWTCNQLICSTFRSGNTINGIIEGSTGLLMNDRAEIKDFLDGSFRNSPHVPVDFYWGENLKSIIEIGYL